MERLQRMWVFISLNRIKFLKTLFVYLCLLDKDSVPDSAVFIKFNKEQANKPENNFTTEGMFYLLIYLLINLFVLSKS
jgi:hypothetical protein